MEEFNRLNILNGLIDKVKRLNLVKDEEEFIKRFGNGETVEDIANDLNGLCWFDLLNKVFGAIRDLQKSILEDIYDLQNEYDGARCDME